MSEFLAVGHDLVTGKTLNYSRATWLLCKLFRKMEELLHRQRTQKMHCRLPLLQLRRREREMWLIFVSICQLMVSILVRESNYTH